MHWYQKQKLGLLAYRGCPCRDIALIPERQGCQRVGESRKLQSGGNFTSMRVPAYCSSVCGQPESSNISVATDPKRLQRGPAGWRTVVSPQ